ncbi:uncharacterized protein BDV17DRAFT_214505 [Aspergillus undulatus]|uniref:uncharacterized protein n=1 Tax=Aspergillus undulatus TaxID=1810928 RepID=UPI003CCD5A77
MSCLTFVVTMHHALYNGWTLGLIFDRVKQNYDGCIVSSRMPFLFFFFFPCQLFQWLVASGLTSSG